MINGKYPVGLVYEAAAPYDSWLKFIWFGVPAITLIIAIVLLFIDPTGTWVLLGVTVFYALLFYLIMPRRYQIFEDRLRIVLAGPFGMNIPFRTIKEAITASGSKTMAYSGIRFATSRQNVVEIKRKSGSGVIISPANRDIFLEQLKQAMKAYECLNR